MWKTGFSLFFFAFCCLPLSLLAQNQLQSKEKNDTIPFMKRWSIFTNTVDWVLATPNLGVEMDLSGSPETHYSILLNGKYNWNTYHSIQPRLVYNVAAGQIEFRKYWRTGGAHGTPEKRYTSPDTTIAYPLWLFRRFRRNVLSGRTYTNPRTWRAYYLGIYAGYEKYTINLGHEGKQGDSYNFGLTGGWSIPLYPFKNGRSVDLDLGLAIGAKLTAYDKFGYDEEFGCYTFQGRKERHFVPYPVIQDIHLSFVFRFRTIGKKVQGGDLRYQKWDEMQEEKLQKRTEILQRNWAIRDSMYKVRQAADKAEEFTRDSLRKAKAFNDSIMQLKKEQAKEKEESYKKKENREKGKSAEQPETKKSRRKSRRDAKKDENTSNNQESNSTPDSAANRNSGKDRLQSSLFFYTSRKEEWV